MRGKGKDTVAAAKQESKRDASRAEQTPERRQSILADKTIRQNTKKDPSAYGRLPKDEE